MNGAGDEIIGAGASAAKNGAQAPSDCRNRRRFNGSCGAGHDYNYITPFGASDVSKTTYQSGHEGNQFFH